ncbi:MAG: hypothetical protein WC746_01665 [archaeon]
MYDPYSEPNYNPGGGSMPQQPQGFQMPQINMPNFDNNGLAGPSMDIKKFIPLIIVLIIVAIIGFAVLTWLGMQHTVTINLTDTDGTELEGTLILKDSQGTTIKSMTPKNSSSSFTGTLMEGDYAATVSAIGYNKTNKSIKVTSEKNTFTIEVPRNLTATLSMSLEATEIYDGQTITGTLTVHNTGDSFNLTDIISASSSNIDAKIINTSPETIIPGDVVLDFNAKVKSATALSQLTPASIQFKVRGTTILSEKKDLSALPVVSDTEIEITPSGKITTSGLTAGTRTPLKITITNKNKKFPVKNVLVTINTDNSDYTQNLSWLEFNQSITNKPNSILIDNIDPNNGKKEITLYITPPINSAVNDAFIGYLSLTSYSIKREKKPDVEFKVTIAKKADLQLLGIDSPFNVTCSRATSSCEVKPLTPNAIRFKNNGNVDITNVSFEVALLNPASTSNCQQYLTRFVTTNTDPLKIPLIKAGTEEPITTELTASFEDTATYADCVITWKYIDPVANPTATVNDSKKMTIKKTTTN